jgi:hypothetical protein
MTNIIAACQVGGHCTGHIEEDARISPFFKQSKTGINKAMPPGTFQVPGIVRKYIG